MIVSWSEGLAGPAVGGCPVATYGRKDVAARASFIATGYHGLQRRKTALISDFHVGRNTRWLGSRVVSVLDSGTEGPIKSQCEQFA